MGGKLKERAGSQMKPFWPKHFVILTLICFFVAFIKTDISAEGSGMGDVYYAVYYFGNLAGRVWVLIAVSLIPALFVSLIYWLVARRSVQAVFTISAYSFLAAAIIL